MLFYITEDLRAICILKISMGEFSSRKFKMTTEKPLLGELHISEGIKAQRTRALSNACHFLPDPFPIVLPLLPILMLLHYKKTSALG